MRFGEKRIEIFILDQPFLTTVDRALRGALGIGRDTSDQKLKSMDADVAILKAMFHKLIGSTWAVAGRANHRSQLLTGRYAREKPGWKQYEDVANKRGDDSTSSYVRRHVMSYAFSHEWRP